MSWNTFWSWGASYNAGRAANETKELRKTMEKQNEIMRKSSMSAEQIAAEENAKTLRQGMWIAIIGGLLFISACFTYPIFGICVAVVLVGIIVFIVVRKKNKKSK